MIRFQDCKDYCDLTEDEVEAIGAGMHATPMEACALAQKAEVSPEGREAILKCMNEYLALVESHEHGKQHVKEVHDAIERFAAHHANC